MSVFVDYFITQGITIAQACAWKLCNLAAKKSPSSTLFGQAAIKAILMPEMDKLDEKITNQSLRILYTAQTHMQHALSIMHGISLDDDKALMAKTAAVPTGGLPVTEISGYIPDEAKKLAHKAFAKASEAYHDHNLSVKMRATAAQIVFAASAIEHFAEPRIVATIWADQLNLMCQTTEFQACVEAHLSKNVLKRAVIASSEGDFKHLVNLVLDFSRALCYYPISDARTTLLTRLVHEKLQSKWSNHLNLTRHNYDIPLAARAYDVAALAQGTVLISTYIQILFKIQMGPRIVTDELPGHFSALSYDAERNRIWALKSNRDFYLVDPNNLEIVENIVGPDPPASLKRWRASVSGAFAVVAAEFEAGGHPPHIYITEDALSANWHRIALPSELDNLNVLSVAASYKRSEGIRLAVCVPKKVMMLTLEARSPFHVKSTTTLSLDEIGSAISINCCVDEDNRLIIAAWKQGLYITDSTWTTVQERIRDPDMHQPQGVCAKDGEIYVLLPNLLRCYDYVLLTTQSNTK